MDPRQFGNALRAAQQGDEQAFATIWRSLNPPLLRFLRVSVGPTDHEDVATAVWMDAVRALALFVGGLDDFRGWLFTIARRRVIDHHRSNARRPALARGEPGVLLDLTGDGPAHIVSERLATEAALDLIGMLKADQAEVVALRVIADLDVNTVAEITGKPAGTVRVLAHRGLRELARRIDADGNPEKL